MGRAVWLLGRPSPAAALGSACASVSGCGASAGSIIVLEWNALYDSIFLHRASVAGHGEASGSFFTLGGVDGVTREGAIHGLQAGSESFPPCCAHKAHNTMGRDSRARDEQQGEQSSHSCERAHACV